MKMSSYTIATIYTDAALAQVTSIISPFVLKCYIVHTQSIRSSLSKTKLVIVIFVFVLGCSISNRPLTRQVKLDQRVSDVRFGFWQTIKTLGFSAMVSFN